MAWPWLLIRRGATPAVRQAGFPGILSFWMRGGAVQSTAEPEQPAATGGRKRSIYSEVRFLEPKKKKKKRRPEDEIAAIEPPKPALPPAPVLPASLTAALQVKAPSIDAQLSSQLAEFLDEEEAIMALLLG